MNCDEVNVTSESKSDVQVVVDDLVCDVIDESEKKSNAGPVNSGEDFYIDKQIVNLDKYRGEQADWSSDSESDSSASDDSSSSSSSSSSCSSETDGECEVSNTEIKTLSKDKNAKPPVEEGLQNLPPIENLTISVGVEEITFLGTVSSFVEELVVIQAAKGHPPLNLESVLFLETGQALGKIFDVFGQVAQPYYSIRFNSSEDIADKKIKINDKVFCAPDHPEFTQYVFLAHLKRIKATDASWKDDQEPPEDCVDFSDDEMEQRVNGTLKSANTNNRDNNGRRRKTPKRNNNSRFQQNDQSNTLRHQSQMQPFRCNAPPVSSQNYANNAPPFPQVNPFSRVPYMAPPPPPFSSTFGSNMPYGNAGNFPPVFDQHPNSNLAPPSHANVPRYIPPTNYHNPCFGEAPRPYSSCATAGQQAVNFNNRNAPSFNSLNHFPSSFGNTTSQQNIFGHQRPSSSDTNAAPGDFVRRFPPPGFIAQ